MDVPVDDGDALEPVARMVLGLTLAAGAMVALGGVVERSPATVVAIPTSLLLVLLVARAIPAAGWCGVAVWTLLAPMARHDGILATFVMVAVCAAIALRPSRVLAWFTDAPPPRRRRADLEPAWIEEL
ncbi:MAG: hypothetical protein M3Y29_04880 [Chloroflexota bacterium]|jgi:hypothetical protein|nr:hypothetical protein [Chloroflexota bacterium]